MSEQGDDLELQALQRELDDAFATTRPRRGFEDELWVRMQARRPLGGRLREALAGFVQRVREVPAVPAAAVAAVVIVALAVGVFSLGGLGRGGSTASTAAGGGAFGPATNKDATSAQGAFGRLPAPSFSSSVKAPNVPTVSGGQASGISPTPYLGPANLTWTGQLTITASTLPVFRYREPSTNTADQFASALGASLQRRPAGVLGLYEATDYTLSIQGTVQSPPQGPSFFILSGPSLPAIDAAGAAPADVATLFLAEHGLVPQWPYTADVQAGTGGLTRVRLLREFAAGQYGPAYLVDAGGERTGLEVDLEGNRPLVTSGPLPITTESAGYPIISGDQAVRSAIASEPIAGPGAPTVQLSRADVVYVLVAAGDHSFYEPAFLFSGSFRASGQTYVKRILVPAIDRAHLSS